MTGTRAIRMLPGYRHRLGERVYTAADGAFEVPAATATALVQGGKAGSAARGEEETDDGVEVTEIDDEE